ncbi:MAG: ribonuclease [Oscillibacter sp.]|nr:ribonuclease [Oscillibacter sp.]
MKKWLCLWISFLLSVSLAACGGADTRTESPDLLDTVRGFVTGAGAEEAAETWTGANAEEAAETWTDNDTEEAAETWTGAGAEEAAETWTDNDTEELPARTDAPEAVTPNEEEPPIATSELPEEGSYTTKEDVALYLHLYGRLPGNFITKKQAQALGWSGGSLEAYAPGKCIGGDRFGNYEGLLPSGRSYQECDINTLGAKSRGAERLVFSGDGLIYYTGDHYNTFTLLYGTP